MNPNLTALRIKLAAKILASWTTEEQKAYPGIRVNGDSSQWTEHYGVPIDNDIPDFIKKDNDGWDYVTKRGN